MEDLPPACQLLRLSPKAERCLGYRRLESLDRELCGSLGDVTMSCNSDPGRSTPAFLWGFDELDTEWVVPVFFAFTFPDLVLGERGVNLPE